MIGVIVAVDENWGIGSINNLLANIPEDMKFFKEKTTDNVVIMGRKTYESLPVRPLPNRTNIVITSKVNRPLHIDENGIAFVSFVSMDFIKSYLQTLPIEPSIDYYVIGGGQIYKELLPYCDCAYVTKINHAYDNVDTYFPNIDDMHEWELVEQSEVKKHNDIEYRFCMYKKHDNRNEMK